MRFRKNRPPPEAPSPNGASAPPDSALSGARTDQRTLGILVVELDHFKRISDRHGHEAGNAILWQFAALLERSVRPTDIVTRWGGEEFVVLAPDADRETLQRMVDRIRRQAQTRLFALPSGPTVRVTCSIGYTAFPQTLDRPGVLKWEEAIAIADRALYHAKSTGPNRAVGVFLADGVRMTLTQAAKAIRNAGLVAAEAAGLLEVVLTEEEEMSRSDSLTGLANRRHFLSARLCRAVPRSGGGPPEEAIERRAADPEGTGGLHAAAPRPLQR